MPLTKKDYYCCIGGGGDAITYLAGAAAGISAVSMVHGWAGVSAGAIIAAAKSFSVRDKDILATLKKVFSGKIIQLSSDSFGRGGVLDWSVVGDIIDEILGKDVTCGDAFYPLVICATNLDTGSPIYFSKLHTPRVLVREALMASSSFMGFATPAVPIPSLGTKLSPDVRLFCDGGWTDNTCDHAWEKGAHPRIMLRLAPDNSVVRTRPGDLLGIGKAVLRSSLFAQNQLKSKRYDGKVIDLPFRNNWDFFKSAEQVEAEYDKGHGAAIYATDKDKL